MEALSIDRAAEALKLALRQLARIRARVEDALQEVRWLEGAITKLMR